jgi:hypothetical protein
MAHRVAQCKIRVLRSSGFAMTDSNLTGRVKDRNKMIRIQPKNLDPQHNTSCSQHDPETGHTVVNHLIKLRIGVSSKYG